MISQSERTRVYLTGGSSTPFLGKAGHRVREVLAAGGMLYLLLYVVRWIVQQAGEVLDRSLVHIEQRRVLVQPWAISSRRFTTAYLRDLYNNYEWPEKGEEWTKSREWKDRILSQVLIPNVPLGSTVVEIGPGGGRWTSALLERADKLCVIDVSARALDICKERFAQHSNIEYVLGDGHTISLPDASVDAIWSFDVFVHINPIDTFNYFREFRRVLRPGGRGVIHHPGVPSHTYEARPGGRSDLTDAIVANFAREVGLELVCQTADFVTNEGDILTIFRKPS